MSCPFCGTTPNSIVSDFEALRKRQPHISGASSALYFVPAASSFVHHFRACGIRKGVNTVSQTLAASALSYPSCSGRVSKSIDSEIICKNDIAREREKPSFYSGTEIPSVLDDLPKTANFRRNIAITERPYLAPLVSSPFLSAFLRPLRNNLYHSSSQPCVQAASTKDNKIMAHQKCAANRQAFSVGHRLSGDEGIMNQLPVANCKGASTISSLETGDPVPGRPPDSSL